MPIRRIKFNKFPTPKYLSAKKIVKKAEIIIPRLVFSKIIEAVKSKERNKKTKKTSSAPNACGSIKYITYVRLSQRMVVITNEGKKFFLFKDSFRKVLLRII